ncbi:MAG: D-amino-acid dehydrogenase [Limisphaerales bacterium]|nr:MAG: D-amino-acid dehydrogenase [Limisphaerales bacterium]KAG0510594.1 MAG: D-amino-acid dehydrogenase [Limisphaerales bacterium]TXT52866.1 MAG: D-amino-acid dehydrogenase [Limisphaerales bacterium]
MSKHILIIGSGVIGLSTAYYCARRGHRVTVLERGPESRDGCSFGNAGMITPSHFVPLAAPGMVVLGLKWMWNPESPFYIKPRLDWDLFNWAFKFWQASTAARVNRAAPLLRDLNLASRACFEELEDTWSGSSRREEAPTSQSAVNESLLTSAPTGDFGLVTKGLLMLCKTQHRLDEEAEFAAHANRLGVPAQVLDAKQAAAMDPAVTLDVVGAVFFPKDAHLPPGRFMAALLAQCVAAGVQFEWNAEVVGWRAEAKRVVEVQLAPGAPVSNRRDVPSTAGAASDFPTQVGHLRSVAFDEFVLCGGAWSPLLARELGLSIPMQAGKGYSLTLPKPPQLPQLCSICTEARLAVTPMGTALRFGGTMEIAGLNEDINPVRVRGIIKSALKYFPAFKESDFDGVQPWRGLRPCSPDGLPYIGRTTKFANLSIATGHAMMGLSLGPITGRLMAQVLSGEPPQFDLSLLSPDRYA